MHAAGGIAELSTDSPWVVALAGAGSLSGLTLWLAAGAVVALAGCVLAAVNAAVKAHARQVDPGVGEWYVGREAVAVTPLDPDGYVLIDGERWAARSLGGPVPRGGRVLIARQHGLHLSVLSVHPAAGQAGDAAEPQSLPPP